MTRTLELEVFFFNAKTDYLPYYKRFRLPFDTASKTSDVLAAIAQRNRDFAYPKSRLVFRINGWMCQGDEPIETLIRRCGQTWRIEPAQIYRSTHCLVINDDDFAQAYERLSSFCDEEDKAYFESLYALHYASVTFDYEKTYAGDAALALAARLIEKYPDKADAVRNAVKDDVAMCEYENGLFEPFDLEPIVQTLRPALKSKQTLFHKLTSRFKAPQNHTLPVPTVKNTSVALYAPKGDREKAIGLLSEKGASLVEFAKSTRRNGRTIVDGAKALAMKKAADILLDAFDSGAQIVVCLDEEDAYYFIKYRKELERAAGRDIQLLITSYDAIKNGFAEDKAA